MIYKFRDTTAIDTSLQTKEGSLVTIENPDEVIDLKSLTVDLEPIQDLNGYSKPWVGGAGKNKLKINASSQTVKGMTFTVNSDGSVTVNGTTTEANCFFNLNYISGQINIPTGVPINIGRYGKNVPSALNVEAVGNSGTNYKTVSGTAEFGISDDWTMTSTSATTSTWLRLQIQNAGTTINNVTVYPFYCYSSNKMTEYEPYENVCPISGHTEVDTKRTGKNLLNSALCVNRTSNGITTTHNADGSITFSGTASSTNRWWSPSDNMNVFIKAGTYTLSSSLSMRLYFHNSGYKSGTFTLTADDTIDNIRFVITNGTIYNTTVKPQLELGTTATAYEPYQSDTYTTDLGRTVYGGTLDVTSGVLTNGFGEAVFKTGRYSLSGPISSSIYPNTYVYYNGTLGGLIEKNSGNDITKAVCAYLPSTSRTLAGGNNEAVGLFQYHGDSTNQFRIAFPKEERFSTSTKLMEWLDSLAEPFTVYYPLATPQTYQLTAQQISLLLGGNNIWSSGGNVTVKYAIDPALYQGMPTEAVSINGRFLEKLIDGYRTLYTKGRESLEVELGTYSTGTADGEKIKNHRYPARVLTVGFQLLSSTPEEFRERFNQLNNILSLEEADFIFADETDKFFTGTPIMDASVEAGQMNVTGEWKIYCGYPFKRSVQPITLTSTTDATISGNTATFNFNYKGVMPSKPLLRCEFASAKSGGDYTEDGDCGFVAFLNADESIIQLGNPEVIDVDATNKNEALINSEFDAFTGWTNSGKTIRSINDPYWNNGAGQTQNYASGVGTLRRNIASTIGFELDMVHRLSVSSPTQTGTFKTLLKNGNTTVVGFSIEKTGSGTAGTVKYIINDKVVGTDAIDLSQYNEHFGYCNRTPVYVAQTYYTQVVTYVKKKKKKKKKKVVSWVANTRWVQSGWNYTQSNLNSGISRDGAVVTFSVGELPDRTFKDSDIATKPCTSISIESTGTFDTNAVRSVALIQKAGVPFAEIPNVFTAGDIVEADCNSANVFLYRKGSMTGHLEPQYGALGNDWEDFEIKVGQNAIRAVWSDWVNTNYKPVIKIIFNEVYI